MRGGACDEAKAHMHAHPHTLPGEIMLFACACGRMGGLLYLRAATSVLGENVPEPHVHVILLNLKWNFAILSDFIKPLRVEVAEGGGGRDRDSERWTQPQFQVVWNYKRRLNWSSHSMVIRFNAVANNCKHWYGKWELKRNGTIQRSATWRSMPKLNRAERFCQYQIAKTIIGIFKINKNDWIIDIWKLQTIFWKVKILFSFLNILKTV